MIIDFQSRIYITEVRVELSKRLNTNLAVISRGFYLANVQTELKEGSCVRNSSEVFTANLSAFFSSFCTVVLGNYNRYI